MFDNLFDITDKSILHDALLSYGRIWKSDYKYLARIKNLFDYLGFNTDEFNGVVAANSFEDILKEIQDERERTKIS